MLKKSTKSNMNIHRSNFFLVLCFLVFPDEYKYKWVCRFLFFLNKYVFSLVIFMEILPYLISCFIFQKWSLR